MIVNKKLIISDILYDVVLYVYMCTITLFKGWTNMTKGSYLFNRIIAFLCVTLIIQSIPAFGFTSAYADEFQVEMLGVSSQIIDDNHDLSEDDIDDESSEPDDDPENDDESGAASGDRIVPGSADNEGSDDSRPDRSDNDKTISTNAVIDNAVSDNEISENEVSENAVSENEVSENEITLSSDDIIFADGAPAPYLDEDGNVPVFKIELDGANRYFDTFDSQESYELIGKCKINADGSTITYVSANGFSVRDTYGVTVPERIAMVSYNGTNSDYVGKSVLIDYTSGYSLESDGVSTADGSFTASGNGFAVENNKLVTKTVRVTNPDGTTSENNVPVYIGEPYTVTDLAETTFNNPDAAAATMISFPGTIKNDINYKWFVDCTEMGKVSQIIVTGYAPSSLEPKDVSVRYYADEKSQQGVSYGVLVDYKVSSTNAQRTVIWCPPNYGSDTFQMREGGLRYEIGAYAFKNVVHLKHVKKPDTGIFTLQNIGKGAFEGCKNLLDLNIFVGTISKIGDYAFKGCEKLSAVTLLPNYAGRTALGVDVFYHTAITELKIPRGYNSLSGQTFNGMSKLAKLTADDNTIYKSVDDVLYRTVPKEELVCFPSAKTTSAYCQDSDVASPDTLQEDAFLVPYTVKGFDPYCFWNCQNLRVIYFPSTILDIDSQSISSCKALNKLYFYSGLPDSDDLTKRDDDFVDFFTDCITSNLTVYAGKGTKIDDYIESSSRFTSRNKCSHIYDESQMNISDTGEFKGFVNDEYISDETHRTYEHVIIPDFKTNADGSRGAYITKVANATSASGCGALSDKKIKSVRILNHMSDIKSTSFYDSAMLSDINAMKRYSRDLSDIYVEEGNNKFTAVEGVLYTAKIEKDDNNEDIKLPDEFVYYPSGNPRTEFTLEKIEYLPRFAFLGSHNLRYINIYDDIVEIGHGGASYQEWTSFVGAYNLAMVNILHDENVTVRNIHYQSDDGVLYLKEPYAGESGTPKYLVYFPVAQTYADSYNDDRKYDDGIRYMSYKVLDGCEEVISANDVKYLRRIIMPASVEKIHDDAFVGCDVLKDVVFSSSGGLGIKEIGDRAFYQVAGLERLSLPGTVIEIGESAFSGCPRLSSINVNADKLEVVGDKAFYMDDALKSISISATSKDARSKFITMSLGNYAISTNPALTSIKLNYLGDTTLGSYAFGINRHLTAIDLKGTDITALGSSCFANDLALESLDLSDTTTLTTIDPSVFQSCINLEKIKLPTSVVTIDDRAFYNCGKLSSINLSDLVELETIGDNAFENCALVSVTIPSNALGRTLTLGNSVFKNNNNTLKNIFIPGNVSVSKTTVGTRITDHTFYNYTKRDDLVIYGFKNSEADTLIKSMLTNSRPNFVAMDPTIPGTFSYSEMPFTPMYADARQFRTATITATILTGMPEVGGEDIAWFTEDNTIISLSAPESSVSESRVVITAKKPGRASVMIKLAKNGYTRAFDVIVGPNGTVESNKLITFAGNGGSNMGIKEISSGQALPSPFRPAYTFTGWYTAPSGGTRITNSNQLKNEVLTLYAQWTYDLPKQNVKITSKNLGKMGIKWTKNAKATGYEIQYTRKKKFNKGYKTKIISNPNTNTAKLSGLKGECRVRIRSYKVVDGIKYYGDWSKVKKAKISRR